MSNKSIGTAFERRVCDVLAADGYWVHFIMPDARGAQPFDIIAVKNKIAYAIDCKTCVANRITFSRLEDNQVLAFEMWLRRGNTEPIIAVEHNDCVYFCGYGELKERKSIPICNLKLSMLTTISG